MAKKTDGAFKKVSGKKLAKIIGKKNVGGAGSGVSGGG